MKIEASLNNSFGNLTAVGEVFIERGFFRSGVTMAYVSEDEKVPVERERLTILQMVGEIEEDEFE